MFSSLLTQKRPRGSGMDETLFQVLEFANQGYCCSQIMLLLFLQHLQEEHPALIRSAQALCTGAIDRDKDCGILNGGLLVLGLYCGKGEAYEEPDARLPLLLTELHTWFRDSACASYGGTSCAAIIGQESPAPHPQICGELTAKTYEKIYDLLLENGFDPAQGK